LLRQLYGAIAIPEAVYNEMVAIDKSVPGAVEVQTLIRATADHQFMTETGEMRAINEIFQRGLKLKQVEAPWPKVLRCA
jgi:hypothetical protein